MPNVEPKSIPRFHMRSVPDPEASEKAGHPMFKEVEFIEVRHPGAIHTIPCVRVKQNHIDMWPDHYKAFKEGVEVPLQGFAIEEWAPMTRSMADTMKAIGVRTVEDLANMPETTVQQYGAAIQSWRLKAQNFLEEHNSEQVQINALKEENKTLTERLAKLEAAMENTETASSDEEPEEKKDPPKVKAKGK